MGRLREQMAIEVHMLQWLAFSIFTALSDYSDGATESRMFGRREYGRSAVDLLSFIGGVAFGAADNVRL